MLERTLGAVVIVVAVSSAGQVGPADCLPDEIGKRGVGGNGFVERGE